VAFNTKGHVPLSFNMDCWAFMDAKTLKKWKADKDKEDPPHAMDFVFEQN